MKINQQHFHGSGYIRVNHKIVSMEHHQASDGIPMFILTPCHSLTICNSSSYSLNTGTRVSWEQGGGGADGTVGRGRKGCINRPH